MRSALSMLGARELYELGAGATAGPMPSLIRVKALLMALTAAGLSQLSLCLPVAGPAESLVCLEGLQSIVVHSQLLSSPLAIREVSIADRP